MIISQVLPNMILWGGWRLWQRNRDAFRRSWKVEGGGIVIEPFVLLGALGFGLGSYINDFGEVGYAHYIAPGIVAGYAMFHATFDSTYAAYLRMETHNIYEAILFTPLEPEDIVAGEVLWGSTRATLSGTAVLVVAATLGLADSPLAILAIPAAFLIGATFASIAMILTATATTIGAMNNFFTLFVLPMFWVSGIFFPLERLPEWLQQLAWALPLTSAAALIRGLFTGQITWLMFLWAGQLFIYGLIALIVASKLMRRRLIK